MRAPSGWTRRRVLAATVLLAATPAVPATARLGLSRRIVLRNLHTGAELDVQFFRDGVYCGEALAQASALLRDLSTGAQRAIDPTLLDFLVEVAHRAGVDPVFDVLCGYRSADRGLHVEGRAADVRLAGVHCQAAAGCAAGLARGGVGYYRRSDFVHLDTGAFRTWRG